MVTYRQQQHVVWFRKRLQCLVEFRHIENGVNTWDFWLRLRTKIYSDRIRKSLVTLAIRQDANSGLLGDSWVRDPPLNPSLLLAPLLSETTLRHVIGSTRQKMTPVALYCGYTKTLHVNPSNVAFWRAWHEDRLGTPVLIALQS